MSGSEEQGLAHMDVEQIDGLVAAAGADGAREILEAFWQSTASLLQNLQAELAEQALDKAARTAHAVKGSAANVGAKRLSSTASAIEVASKTGDAGTASENLERAKQDFADFQECFAAHIANA